MSGNLIPSRSEQLHGRREKSKDLVVTLTSEKREAEKLFCRGRIGIPCVFTTIYLYNIDEKIVL